MDAERTGGAARRVGRGARYAGLVLLCLLLSSCGEALGPSADSASRQQGVLLVPEFKVVGAPVMPDALQFSYLGLSISEIRLDPLDAGGREVEAGALAYSTRKPIHLDFNIDAGQNVLYGDPLVLPRTGRYLISVRLEPMTRVERTRAGLVEVTSPSMSVEGFVSFSGSMLGFTDEKGDGSPVPMPFDEKGLNCDGGACPGWTPFYYDSKRSFFIALNEIDIDERSDYLSFEFNIENWAQTLVEPIQTAVQDYERPADNADAHGMDITNRMDSTGLGAESLFGNARVRSIGVVR